MKNLKLVPLLALCLGLTTFAFAGDKSAKANDSKADAKATANVEAAATPKQADAKADETDTYYYLVGALDENGNYPLTFEPGGPSLSCSGMTDPCEISSTTELSSQISKTELEADEGNGIDIIGRQN